MKILVADDDPILRSLMRARLVRFNAQAVDAADGMAAWTLLCSQTFDMAIVDLGLPDFINRLIPIVEAQFQTPVGNDFGTGVGTTGTVNPGVIWVGDKFQLAVEAIIPVNRASGSSVGIMGQVHFYLDDIFPNSIGRPIFASNTPGGPAFGR